MQHQWEDRDPVPPVGDAARHAEWESRMNALMRSAPIAASPPDDREEDGLGVGIWIAMALMFALGAASVLVTQALRFEWIVLHTPKGV